MPLEHLKKGAQQPAIPQIGHSSAACRSDLRSPWGKGATASRCGSRLEEQGQ